MKPCDSTIGNPFRWMGDRYEPHDDLRTISDRIMRDARIDLAGVDMSIVRRVRIGSRMLDISIRRHPDDLGSMESAKMAIDAVHGHAIRYGWDDSMPESDLFRRHYGVNVEIHACYWGERQRRRHGFDAGGMNPTSFMRSVSTGDLLIEDGHMGSRLAYRVISTSRGRFVTDDGLGGSTRMTWHAPHRDCLIVHGDRVRIAMGSISEPDRHLLLTWKRCGSGTRP